MVLMYVALGAFHIHLRFCHHFSPDAMKLGGTSHAVLSGF
jgi:hypothetical protein